LWLETLGAGFVGYVFAGWVFVLIYLAIQWFMQATDITISYNWIRVGGICHPVFEIRNRSKSKTYMLAKIEYSNGPDRLAWFDNKSLMGKVLKPGSINQFEEIAPVRNTSSIAECMQLRVAVRLQTGRKLWIPGRNNARVHNAAIRFREFLDA
jgi:hypothetical protein